MAIPRSSIDEYVSRFRKNTSTNLISSRTSKQYKSNLYHLAEIDALEYVFDVEKFVEKVKLNGDDVKPKTLSSYCSAVIKLLSVLKTSEFKEHWKDRDDFSYYTVNNVLSKYRQIIVKGHEEVSTTEEDQETDVN